MLAINVHHSGNTVTFIDKVRPGLLFRSEVTGDYLYTEFNEKLWVNDIDRLCGKGNADCKEYKNGFGL